MQGNHNQLTITGHCPGVTISGNNNHVFVDTTDSADISGNGNELTYHSLPRPTTSITGHDDSIQRG